MSDNKNNVVPASNGGSPLQVAGTAPAMVPLGNGTSMDLSFLPEDERKALMAEHAKEVMAISREGMKIGVDVTALHRSLETMAQNTNQVAKDGNSVTITHSQQSGLGRTEVIMGNTDAATKGKLSRSQTGERDWTPYYVFGGLIALVLIVVAFAGAK